MSVQVGFDAAGGFMRVTATGVLSFDVFVETFEALVTHESYRPGTNTLWDFREAALGAVSTETLRRIERFAAERQAFRRGARIAAVAASDTAFGVARIFEVLSADLPVQFRVFRDLAEAEAWASGPQPD